jgi:hypothetical protein
MNDLNQINASNQASVTNTAIQAARAAGKFVLAAYDGLHLVGHNQFDDKVAADAALAETKAAAGASERFEVLAPTATAPAA